MKNVKKIFSVAVISMAVCTANTHAQIPTTDVVQIGTDIVNQVETIGQWAAQLAMMKTQIENLKEHGEQFKKQIENATGKRLLGQIAFDEKFQNSIASDFSDTYDSIRGSGYSGLNAKGQNIYNSVKVFDACEKKTGTYKTLCESKAVIASQHKAHIQDAFKSNVDRIGQIKQLMASIDDTTDQKGSEEIQARIAAEEAAIANEQSKLQLYQMAAVNEEKMLRQQEREEEAKAYSTGFKENTPIAFN